MSDDPVFISQFQIPDVSDFVDDKKVADIPYCGWQETADGFFPTVEFKFRDKLPKGCYKIEFDNRSSEYLLKEFNYKSDEAYRFSESYTEKVLKEVQDFWNKEEVYKKYGLTHKRGLLLEGAAGTGKSVLITLLIEDLLQSDGIIFIINNMKEFSLLLEALPTIITKIEKNRKIITVIEDIDKLIASNNGDDSHILDFLDGKNSVDHHLVIMTSNDTTDLSAALLRPSRVDMRFVVNVPTSEVRKEYLRKKGIDESLLDLYTKKTKGMSFAQLKEVFTGTVILGKNIDEVVNQLNNPLESKDYLNKKTKIGL